VQPDDVASTELLFQLGMAFQLMLEEFVSRMDAAGYPDLRPVHGLVFQSLLRGATTSSEIGAALGVTKQAAGQIVNDLEDAGYLRRSEHPGGGRRRLVSLTDKGYAHLHTAGRLLHQLEQEIESGFASGSTSQLRADLTSLIRQFAAGPLPPFRPSW
jgi:DNA-binding MarR family transcriptional regulator